MIIEAEIPVVVETVRKLVYKLDTRNVELDVMPFRVSVPFWRVEKESPLLVIVEAERVDAKRVLA